MNHLPATSRHRDRPGAPGSGRGIAGAVLTLGLLLGWSVAPAGTSGGAGSLLVQSGSGAPTPRGDYVSSAGGLNTYYSYFIEVPPGTPSLQIDIFDINLGGLHDDVVGTNDTATGYQVRDPTDTAVLNFTLPPNTGSDDVWENLFTKASPRPGHWELRVDTSSNITSGNDRQAYGVRAHDGTPGAGGRELNVYVDSFIGPGVTATPPDPATGRFHPYITSGCTAQSNDFDWGASPSPGIVYSSLNPARFTTGPLPTSGNNSWLNQSFGGWTTDESAHDYGIWSLDYSLTPPNKGVLYVGDFNAGAPPPSQPEPDTFRIYLPADAGGPPAKPQMGQGIIEIVSGPNPPVENMVTVFRIAVAINNPTPYPITFSAPDDVVTAAVVGGQVKYAGSATTTPPSTIVDEPDLGDSGTITWDPGTIGAFSFAQLEYNVSVEPQASDTRINITGTPASEGTTAITYLDEACSGAMPACTGEQLKRATHTLGPLCELAVTKDVLVTRAVIGDLRAYGTRRGVVVEWTTLAATCVPTARGEGWWWNGRPSPSTARWAFTCCV